MLVSEPSPSWVVHVVDDDQAVCSALKFALEVEGFNVRTYANADEVLAGADLKGAGCLIVDYNLPGRNGLDLLHELDLRQVRLPAFLITTSPNAQVRRRATAQGVAIIEKPLLGNHLSEAVRAASRSQESAPVQEAVSAEERPALPPDTPAKR